MHLSYFRIELSERGGFDSCAGPSSYFAKLALRSFAKLAHSDFMMCSDMCSVNFLNEGSLVVL